MSPLATLARLVRENSTTYVAGTARIIQTDGSGSARYNAIELLLFHLAEALASHTTERLERWAAREAHDASVDAIAQMLHAACFAILASIEADADLFSAALVRFEFIERRVADAAQRAERNRSGVRPLSAREGARSALLAFATLLDPAAVDGARATARLAEVLANDIGMRPQVVRDVRDATLLLVLDETAKSTQRSAALDVALAVPALDDLARTIAASRQLDIRVRSGVQRLWSREPAAVIVWTAKHVLCGGEAGIRAFVDSTDAARLPRNVRSGLRRLVAERPAAGRALRDRTLRGEAAVAAV